MQTKVVFPRDLDVFITVSEYFITVPEEQVSLTVPWCSYTEDNARKEEYSSYAKRYDVHT